MAKYKPYNYSQGVLLPVYLEAQLIPGTLEFSIHTLVESRVDMRVFDEKYNNDDTGCAAYDPKVCLVKTLYGYKMNFNQGNFQELIIEIYFVKNCLRCSSLRTIM